MPELPEVEAARKLAAANCSGKKITKVDASEDLSTLQYAVCQLAFGVAIALISSCCVQICHRTKKYMLSPRAAAQPCVCAEVFQGHTPDEVRDALMGRTVDDVLRQGKYFWFKLSGEGPDILWHFGMTGYLSIKDVGAAKYVKIKTDETWPPRFTKVELTFEDGTIMAFADARRCVPSMPQRHQRLLQHQLGLYKCSYRNWACANALTTVCSMLDLARTDPVLDTRQCAGLQRSSWSKTQQRICR